VSEVNFVELSSPGEGKVVRMPARKIQLPEISHE